ncbi:MAG: hypothetical protein ACRDF5_10895 [bacterium]
MKETPGASRVILRLGLLALASWLLWVGFRIFPASSTRLIWLPVVFGVYLAALASALAAGTLRRQDHRRARAWILVATLAGVVAWFAVEVTVYYPRYRADTMALSHIAAAEMLRGRNPYTLESAMVIQEVERLGIPHSLLTQTVDGTPFTGVVAYPALHFLVFVPALAAGIRDLRWVVLAFELLALVVLWRWTPKRFQPIVFVPFLVNPDLLVIFTSGLTDWLWVTPLMLTAVSLTRGRIPLAGVAYGCAAAVKPLPWIALPFLLIWLVKSRPAQAPPLGTARLFLGTAVVTFAAINAPFIMLDAGAWARSVATPFLAPLMLDGHGLSALSKMGLFPDSRLLYGALTAGAGTIAVGAYWVFFLRLRDALWVFPAMVMWVSYRSFHNYVLYWIPPAFLWFLLQAQRLGARSEDARLPRAVGSARWSRGVGWVGVLGVVLFIGLTTAIGTVNSSTDPIGLKVIAFSSRADPRIIDAIAVEVTNRMSVPIEPIFTVIRAGQSVPWDVEDGPRTLAAETAAVYGIVAPPGAAALPRRNLYAGDAGGEREPVLLRVTARGTDAAASVWIPGF